MLKYVSYDIVFREVPDEVTLAVNLSGCPLRCEGCHSPHLREDIGDPLTAERLAVLIEQYEGLITCVCLMGGDADVPSVAGLLRFVHQTYPALRTAWYSGREAPPANLDLSAFDYVKLGPYRARLGGLDQPTTNQRLYRVNSDRTLTDITSAFWSKG